MNVDWFRLSGSDYYGDEAQRMFGIAAAHGFDCMWAGFEPWLPGGKSARFTADVNVSGVAAAAQVSFDDPAGLHEFVRTARMIEPREPEATDTYRQLLATTTPPEAGRDDG